MGTVSPLETVDPSHSFLQVGLGPFNSILHKFDVYLPQALYQTLKGMQKMNKTSSLPQRRRSKAKRIKAATLENNCLRTQAGLTVISQRPWTSYLTFLIQHLHQHSGANDRTQLVLLQGQLSNFPDGIKSWFLHHDHLYEHTTHDFKFFIVLLSKIITDSRK